MIVRGLYVPNTPTLLDVTPRPEGFPGYSLTVNALVLVTLCRGWRRPRFRVVTVRSP